MTLEVGDEDGWLKVVYAHDCATCDCCGEPYCEDCQAHYADCQCPGPHQDDEYDYDETGEYARLINHGQKTN